jgi:D-beta-D-heptose 7-phosphate kinase/D-beta-D-heptose 1-phosphate adenosyltransferase
MKNWEEALRFRKSIEPGKVAFTNGVFDILHRGHTEYLAEAGKLGKALILGLNSDSSAGRLKGYGRPLVKQDDRAVVLAALESVSAVVIFDEDTPRELICYLKPDILVKGGDYQIKDIVGASEVRSWGGEVRVIPFRPGFSTTDFLRRLRALPRE